MQYEQLLIQDWLHSTIGKENNHCWDCSCASYKFRSPRIKSTQNHNLWLCFNHIFNTNSSISDLLSFSNSIKSKHVSTNGENTYNFLCIAQIKYKNTNAKEIDKIADTRCNPMHAYLEEHLTMFNGAYSHQVSMHQILATEMPYIIF